MKKSNHWMKKAPSILLILILLALWQIVASAMNAAYILPSPTQILKKLWELRIPLLTVHLPATMAVTGIGFLISVGLGVTLAVAMDASEWVENALYPLIVASQTIPTTAIAPLFVLWFGYTIWGKVLVTILFTFFPVTISVHDGLKGTNRERKELLDTMGANQREIFWKLKVPSAIPSFFSSIKIAIPLSIIGAAIGEWLGAQQGLGYFSKRMMSQLDGAGVFAPVVLLSVVAMVIVGILSQIEKHLIFWREDQERRI